MRSLPIAKCTRLRWVCAPAVAVGRHVDATHRIGLVTLAGCVDADRDVVQGGMLLAFHGIVSFHGVKG